MCCGETPPQGHHGQFSDRNILWNYIVLIIKSFDDGKIIVIIIIICLKLMFYNSSVDNN